MADDPKLSVITKTHRWYRGADKVFKFTVLDLEGSIVDITGWSLSWLLFDKGEGWDGTERVTKTTGDGITITDGPAGECQVAIDAEDTDGLAAGEYYHELRRSDAGYREPLAAGPAWLLHSPAKVTA